MVFFKRAEPKAALQRGNIKDLMFYGFMRISVISMFDW